jgi:predicted CXXCH cytochrome family protein
MTTEPFQPRGKRIARQLLFIVALIGGVAGLVYALDRFILRPDRPSPSSLTPPDLTSGDPVQGPRQLAAGRRLTVWWDELPDEVLFRARPAGEKSNINPSDYIGPDACKKCHSKNYGKWSTHPHRWMNAPASAATVKGDFSGAAVISYRGGRAAFESRGGSYFMRLERGGIRRVYRVSQTIGSRFFQYYVGKQIEGPEPAKHRFYREDHVLPFGYWLDQKEWVPTVHIGPERRDEDRPDPFQPPDRGSHYAEYASSCNYCHTTFPLGDLLGRRPHQMGEHTPFTLHWSVRGYMKTAHPQELAGMERLLTGEGAPGDLDAPAERDDRGGKPELVDRGGESVRNPMAGWEASRYAVTFGVSCEACHLGAREHVESGGEILPRFFPSSPHLFVESRGKPLDFGKTHDNVNWACGRCHTGGRPAFAGGMSTWNSVEYSDAMRGSCYSRLRCVDCHNPHQATGPKWAQSADQDDVSCVKCHTQFKAAEPRRAHTHHAPGSDGARCMNCHMPHINEGLQDVVRTHMIYSPTRPDMIQANHPNACNLCHTDRPIDWTLRYLKEWYGRTYDEGQIGAHYPNRTQPVGLGWLASANESVRLVGADALIRARSFGALPQLLGALDDPYLLNRQFAAKGLQEMLGLRLADFGYHFYMTRDERRQPLADLRARVLRRGGKKK